MLLADYRALSGRYDRLVSIEMIEAIGHQYLDTYFRKVGELLEDDGMALIQAITIEDHRYQQALRSVDFIKRHIFPGSFIPSISAMLGAMARVSDLKLFNLEDIGPSYALTLRAWRERFLSRREQVRALGYPERFVRMWEFYLGLLRRRFHRARDRRRADAADQTGSAARAVRAAIAGARCPAGLRRLRLQLPRFIVGVEPRSRQKSHAFGPFQRKHAAAARHHVDDQVGMWRQYSNCAAPM